MEINDGYRVCFQRFYRLCVHTNCVNLSYDCFLLSAGKPFENVVDTSLSTVDQAYSSDGVEANRTLSNTERLNGSSPQLRTCNTKKRSPRTRQIPAHSMSTPTSRYTRSGSRDIIAIPKRKIGNLRPEGAAADGSSTSAVKCEPKSTRKRQQQDRMSESPTSALDDQMGPRVLLRRLSLDYIQSLPMAERVMAASLTLPLRQRRSGKISGLPALDPVKGNLMTLLLEAAMIPITTKFLIIDSELSYPCHRCHHSAVLDLIYLSCVFTFFIAEIPRSLNTNSDFSLEGFSILFPLS